MRLWQFRFSTNVERVALALAHKGLDADPMVIDPADPVVIDPADRASVRHLTGQDLVPVLEDAGTVVIDSLRILAYLEERFPDARPLYPAEPAGRAQVAILLDWFDGVWKRAPNQLADALAAGRDASEPDLARWAAELRGSLDRFEALLDGRDYLLGANLGVFDVAVFPFLRYGVGLHGEDDELFHRILTEHLSPGVRHSRLRAWIARCDELPRAGIAQS